MKSKTLLKIAELIASESKCVSKQVGCVITVDDRIVSTGYNGTPKNAINCCDHAKSKGWLNLVDKSLNQVFRDDHSQWSLVNEIHAEINAISYAARNGVSINNGVMYCTLSPCENCAKSIVASGIKSIYIDKLYDRVKNPLWKSYLENNDVAVFINN